MAVPANLFDSYEAVGIREDISDLIYNIAPVETPFISAVATSKATQRQHFWQIDGLPTVNGTSSLLAEGDEIALKVNNSPFTGGTALRGNYTQINGVAFGVSGSEEASSKYGRDSEMAYLSAKFGRWLKREVEFGCTGLNQAAAPGDGVGVARSTAPMAAWLTSNVARNGLGANPTLSGGIPNAGAGDGATRPLTIALIDGVMQTAYTNGGKPSLMLMGPSQRTKFSALDGVAPRRIDASERRTMGVSDLYASNFGDLVVVTTRHIRQTLAVDRELYLIDPEMVAVANFRPWQQFDLAKTSDTFRRQMLTEWALEMRNEAAHGVVAELN